MSAPARVTTYRSPYVRLGIYWRSMSLTLRDCSYDESGRPVTHFGWGRLQIAYTHRAAGTL